MKKKIVCFALAIAMVFSTMVMTAEAATTITEAEVIARLSSAESKWPDGTTYVKDKNNPCGSCFGFARELFSYVFGADLPTRWSLSTARFSPSNKNIIEIAHVGRVNGKEYSLNDLKALFSKARPGDVLVMSRGTTNHAVIVRSVVNNGEGIYGYDANSDYKNTIRTNMYRSASSTRKNRPAGVTLYRYVNYLDTEMITVNFDSNGGYVNQTTQIIEKGSDPRNLPTPVREGYIFHGWSLDKIDPYYAETIMLRIASENSAWGFEEDTTLYAYWLPCTNHEKGTYLRCEINHPHYNYYTCSLCGASFTDGSTSNVESCKDCNPDKNETEIVCRWGDWSEWSNIPVSISETGTREVETRQVNVSDGYTEYRYGRYAYTDYRLHTCWCETYMTKLFGGATLQYSDWSSTRYYPTGKGWSCGNCNGNHIGVDHYTNGKPWWAEYSLPDGDYFWEESRIVGAQTQTQYRYRDWINN